MDASTKISELKAEISRISAKLSASKDPDIVEALMFKREALEAELMEAATKAAEPTVEEDTEPSRKLPAEEIEKLIRAARAHFAADRKPALIAAMKELLEVAPNHPDVLELKADQLISTKNYSSAKTVLQKAHKLAPKNKSVEEKLAVVALKSATIGSIEDQLRSGMNDSPFISQGDIQATATAATVASAVLPGAGHLFTGKTTKGFIYLALWFASVVPFLLIFKAEFIASKGRNFDVSMPMIAFGFAALMVYMVALFECAALGKNGSKKRIIVHPRPPVDLPFE